MLPHNTVLTRDPGQKASQRRTGGLSIGHISLDKKLKINTLWTYVKNAQLLIKIQINTL